MNLQAALKSQYHASLDMLLEAIDTCPAHLWTSDQYTNQYWQVAYHTLFYTHLYLQASEADFIPWERHRPGYHRFGTGPDAPTSVIPYSVEEVRAYCLHCQAMVDAAVDQLDLASAESGFSWYRMPKLEHQFVNLRHLQHHTGQLAERLRQTANQGLRWVGGAVAG
jgi:DinB family protein